MRGEGVAKRVAGSRRRRLRGFPLTSILSRKGRGSLTGNASEESPLPLRERAGGGVSSSSAFHQCLRHRHSIQRTLHAQAGTVEYMRVDLRRAHVFVAEQFLHGADV